MNGIKVNGEFLDLFPETRVSITMNNPIFADDSIIPGEFSFPIDIPFAEDSPKNTRILGNLHVMENVQSIREVDATYYYDLLKFKKGKLVILKLIGKRLSVNFKFGLSTLENIKSIKLKEIVDEQIVLNNNTTYVKEVRLDPELSAPYHIIVNGRPYEAATIAELVDAINDDVTEPRASATSFSTYLTVKPFTDQLNIETPFTVDCEDGREWTVTPNDEVWNEPVRSALEAYLVEPYPSDKFRFPTILNPGQFESGYQYFITGLVNASENGEFVFNFSAPEGDGIISFNPFVSHVYTSIAPYVMLKHVLDKIAEHFNFVFEGDFYAQEFIAKALIYTPNSLTIRIPFIGQYPFFFFRQSFNIGEFVPDMTVMEFFKALQTKFNLAVYYKENEKRFVMKFRKTILRDAAYLDITSKCSLILEREDVGAKGITLQIDRDETDKLCPVDSMAIGPEQELSVTTRCFGLAEQKDLTHTIRDIPAVDQPFSNKEYRFLRLMFYEGLQESGNSFLTFDFPKASSHIDGKSLVFQDDAHDEWWQEYVYFLMNRKRIQVSAARSFASLNAIKWDQKIMFDRSKYLYQQLEFSFSMNPNEPAEAKTLMYKT